MGHYWMIWQCRASASASWNICSRGGDNEMRLDHLQLSSHLPLGLGECGGLLWWPCTCSRFDFLGLLPGWVSCADGHFLSTLQLLESHIKNELIEKSPPVHALPSCEGSQSSSSEPRRSSSIACGSSAFEVHMKIPSWAAQVLPSHL